MKHFSAFSQWGEIHQVRLRHPDELGALRHLGPARVWPHSGTMSDVSFCRRRWRFRDTGRRDVTRESANGGRVEEDVHRAKDKLGSSRFYSFDRRRTTRLQADLGNHGRLFKRGFRISVKSVFVECRRLADFIENTFSTNWVITSIIILSFFTARL